MLPTTLLIGGSSSGGREEGKAAIQCCWQGEIWPEDWSFPPAGEARSNRGQNPLHLQIGNLVYVHGL